MSQNQTPLPEYNAPPVSEVALAVHFSALEGWRSAHAGLYWGLINADYPRNEVHPPLLPSIERFGDDLLNAPTAGPPFRLVAGGEPILDRNWFISEDGTRLVQLQQDRFVVNWRKVTGREAYPRYSEFIRPLFATEWQRFAEFVGARRLGAIDVLQCEVTYVNDLIRGDGWDEFSQSLELFTYWSGRGSDGFLPSPEMLNLAGTFLMPENSGRLHFRTQYVLRIIDRKQAIKFELTARGRPRSSSESDVLAWMDLGREWIVRGFTDLTTKRAHGLWRRRR